MRLNLNKRALSTRQTRGRELILECIGTLPGHFSAEDLLFSVRREGQRVSRATVYRTLELLVERGVLQRVHLGERGAQYEVIQGRAQHAHLYCLRCGRLMDYPLPFLGQLAARVKKQRGFQAEHLLLRICGYCRKCRSRGARKGFSGDRKSKQGGRERWEK